jgi:hypothetical protein
MDNFEMKRGASSGASPEDWQMEIRVAGEGPEGEVKDELGGFFLFLMRKGL